jgi:seryl-tRNA synthetase
MSRDNSPEEFNSHASEAEMADKEEQRLLTIPVAKFKERLQRVKRSVIKQYGDVNPEDIAELKETVEQYRCEIERLRKNETELEARSRTLSQDVDNLRQTRADEMVRNQLTTEFLRCNGLPDALHDALSAMMNNGPQFFLSDNNVVTFLDSEKNEKTASEYVEMFLSQRPYFRRTHSLKGSGISAIPTNTGSSDPGMRNYDSRERRLEAARNIIRE